MQLISVIALAPFLGAVLAAPSRLQHEKFHANKRDIVWQTVTDEVVETVIETTTIWVSPGQAAPSPAPSPNSPSPAPAPASPSPAPAPSPSVDSSSGFGGLQNPTPSSSSVAVPAPSPQSPSPAPASSPSPPSPPPAPASSQAPSPPSGGNVPGVSTLPGASVPDGPCTSSDPCTGDGTFYPVGLGACGITNSESDMIVAIPSQMFGTFTNSGADGAKNPLCGRTLEIQLFEGGPTQSATVTDRCGGCAGNQDLDMSQGLFEALGGDTNTGRYKGMTWHWTS